MINKHVDCFANGFLSDETLPVEERVGLGLIEMAKYTTISFKDYILPFVECRPPDSSTAFYYCAGLKVYDDDKYDKLIEKYPEDAEELRYHKQVMWDYLHNELRQPCVDISRYPGECGVNWGGSWGGHANPDFGRVLNEGTDGIRAYIAKCRDENPRLDDDKKGFYRGCELAMDALDILGDRFRELAVKMAAECQDPADKARYERAAKAFEVIPRRPAYDFESACHCFWMLFTLDGIDSPGRFDQFMYRAYSIEQDHDIIYDSLARLWDAFHETRTWNLCISGSDENWNDVTNELSYDILRICRDKLYNTPNLTMRVHRNTPAKLWEEAAKTIGTGINMPVIYNDEVVCAALEKEGIPPCDSHLYCMNGCNQIDIMGKSHMGLEDGEVNLAKCLELALHNGCDPLSEDNKHIGTRTGDARKYETFEQVMRAVKRQISWGVYTAVLNANVFQHNSARYNHNPLRSCLIDGCLEKGIDYRDGGPLYNYGQILGEGLADTGDSLWAIKKLVFDEKKYTMSRLIDALDADFEGYDELYRDFSSCEKFGNDIESVDSITAEIVNHFLTDLKKHRTYRGGQVYMGGCSPLDRFPDNGRSVGALPNGKRRRSPVLADSISATAGNDTHGPTAVMKSVLNYAHGEAGSGFVHQIKFEKSMFCTEKGIESFINLTKSFFDGGAQQLTVTVVSKEDLLDAWDHPEKHRNLIVRVGGYSGYFVQFSRDIQKNVIERTMNSI